MSEWPSTCRGVFTASTCLATPTAPQPPVATPPTTHHPNPTLTLALALARALTLTVRPWGQRVLLSAAMSAVTRPTSAWC